MNKTFVNSAFKALSQVMDERANEFERYGQTPVFDSSEDEMDSVGPI